MTHSTEKPASERIFDALKTARDSGRESLQIDDICKVVFGRADARKRNLVYVTLHRLIERGDVEKLPAAYRLKSST